MAAGASSSAFRRLAAPLAARPAWRDLALGALLLFLCGILPVLATLVAPPAPQRLAFNAAQPASGVRVEQAYGGERNADGPFIWTKPEAAIVVAWPGDGPYDVSFVAQDSPLAPTPRTLTVTLDGTTVESITLSTTPQTYHFRRDMPRGDWQSPRKPLRIDLSTAPLTAPGDPRALGVILRDVTVQPLPLPRPWLLWAALAPAYSPSRSTPWPRPRRATTRRLLGVALGGAASWGLLLFQQPHLALWLGAALTRQPLAALVPPVALALLAALARAWPRTLKRAVLIATVAIPAALQVGVLARLIWGDPVQVPWFDEFFQFAFLFDARQGHITWADLWQPYGGAHRTVFPRLIYAAVLAATPWDRRVWLTVNPLLVGLAFACLAAVVRRTVAPRGLALALIAATGGLLFALSQYGHWLLPFGLQFGLVVCFGALALWTLSARPVGWPQLALAIGATWVASWSSLQGLALWLALLPLVALAGWRKVGVWSACAAAVIGSYAINLPSSTPAPAPKGLLTFTLVNLGAPLGTLQSLTTRGHFWSHLTVQPASRWALIFGVAGLPLLAANLLALWRQCRADPAVVTRALPWCCLALFGVACAAVTALGRAVDGVSTALTSRYHTFALLWWIALLVLGAQATANTWQPGTRRGWPAALAATNLLALVVGALCFAQVTLVSGLLAGDLHGELRRAESCAHDLASAPDSCTCRCSTRCPPWRACASPSPAATRLALYHDAPLPVPAPAADPSLAPDLARLRQLPFGALYAVDGLPGPLSIADGLPPTQLRFAAQQPLRHRLGHRRDQRPPATRPRCLHHHRRRPQSGCPFASRTPRPPAASPPPSAPPASTSRSPRHPPPGQHTLRITIITADGTAAPTNPTPPSPSSSNDPSSPLLAAGDPPQWVAGAARRSGGVSQKTRVRMRTLQSPHERANPYPICYT
ncbi:MAG: hypothetical protein U0232_18370 [Thermomicrobiales bacterium]